MYQSRTSRPNHQTSSAENPDGKIVFTRPRRKLSIIKELILCGLILFCLFLIGVSIFGQHGLLQYREKKRELENLQRIQLEIQLENSSLRERVQKLHTDPSTLEKEIRSKLKYTKPGETVYEIVGKEEKK